MSLTDSNDINNYIEIINNNFKENNFFKLELNDDDKINYDDKDLSALMCIDKSLKMTIFNFMSVLTNDVFESSFDVVIGTILKLSNNSLKTMLLLELFMNIVYNNTDEFLPMIVTNIIEHVITFGSDFIQHFRDRIVSDTNLTSYHIQKLIPLYDEFLSSDAPDTKAKFEILIGKNNEALTHATNNITKLHAHVMLENFNEAFEKFTSIYETRIKLSKDDAVIVLKFFNLLNYASDDQLNYLVNTCLSIKGQSHILLILPYDWGKSNIFANIVLKIFDEKYSRSVQNPEHSLNKLPDLNLSFITVICIANLAFANYDLVEELLIDYRKFCKSIGRCTQYQLMDSSETEVIRKMLIKRYLENNNQTRINNLIASLQDGREKIDMFVRLPINPEKMITDIKSHIIGGYSRSSEIEHALEQLCEVKKYELTLRLYEYYHNYDTKCGFHCDCISTIEQMIESTHDVDFGTQLLTKILKFSYSEHVLYDQIDDLENIAKHIRKNLTFFSNTKIKELTTHMNKYFSFFMINVFCPSIGKLFSPSMFEKEPERKFD